MTSKIFTWLTQARATQFCRKKMHSNQRNLLIKYYITPSHKFHLTAKFTKHQEKTDVMGEYDIKYQNKVLKVAVVIVAF